MAFVFFSKNPSGVRKSFCFQLYPKSASRGCALNQTPALLLFFKQDVKRGACNNAKRECVAFASKVFIFNTKLTTRKQEARLPHRGQRIRHA